MVKDLNEALLIAKFIKEQGYSQTANGITVLTESILKNQILNREELQKEIIVILNLFKKEFAGSSLGSDYRSRCFDDVMEIVLKSMLTLKERFSDLSKETKPFIERMQKVDKSLIPLSEYLSALLVKPDRSVKESLVMFHLACYIYLVSFEGIFDELTKILYACINASTGNISKFNDLEPEKVYTLKKACKQIFGVKPVFLEDWSQKNCIRNAIAHAQAEYDSEKNRAHFISIDPDKGKIVYDKGMDFNDFLKIFMEVADAEDSLRYVMRFIYLIELLTNAYNKRAK